jgi:TolB-like protein/tetratricopeptide (TPR) repeat protein
MLSARRILPERLLLIAALTAATTRAVAQCPNGTPPPCKRGAKPVIPRPVLQLNSHSWIVVPFTNATRAPELEWLRDASVNLLSLDLSRWTDIAVVDDKRVGDLVRELPPARASAALTLSDGIALAKRAGAGMLVMGEFYKLGGGARVAANVFDVKTGNRLRSVTQQAANQDSLLTAFGPLARGVLALPAPEGARLGITGTSNVGAYQEYLLGAAALNRFQLDEAARHLSTAVSLDATFALAHYRLSVVLAMDSGDAVAARNHAAAAARFSTGLPPRERALIAAHLASANGDDARGCATLGSMVARDSMDVEAMYQLGECEYRGGFSLPEPIDSIRGRFRGNWNSAIALFRRVLRVDPSYHPAFSDVLGILLRNTISICQTSGIACSNDPMAWTAVVIRDGDSLVIEPVHGTAYFAQRARAEKTNSRYLNLRAAQAIGREWVESGPGEGRAHRQLAQVDLMLGETAAANAELHEINSHSDPFVRRQALLDRYEVEVTLGRGREARAALDTLRREVRDTSILRKLVDVEGAAVGRFRDAEASIEALAVERNWSRERADYVRSLPRVMLGLPAAGMNALEQRYWNSVAGDSSCSAGLPRCRTSALLATMAYAVTTPRAWWPPYDVPTTGFRFGPARGIAIRDTASLRSEQRYLDSLSHARMVSMGDTQATTIIGADAALALLDSAGALRMTREFTDSIMPAMIRLTSGVIPSTFGWEILFAPRMMLQRADLAAALGHSDEARIWYTKVLDLWADADPELQPTVARIRTAMAKLATSGD